MYKKIIVISGVLLFMGFSSFSQKTRLEKEKEDEELSKSRSKFERFDQTTLKSDEEKKKEQISNEEKRLHIIMYLDTVPMKEGLRTKLRKDLDENPFSTRFQKFMLRYKKGVILNDDEDKLIKQ